jgi:ribonuclease VapC
VLAVALMTIADQAEVPAKLADSDMPEEESFDAVAGLDLGLISAGVSLVRASARPRVEARSTGVSLGARGCLAFAEVRRAAVLNADRVGAKLELPLDTRVVR